jgi:hypothetical protein
MHRRVLLSWKELPMRAALLASLLLLPFQAAGAEPLWQTLPPTPAPVAGEHTGHAKVNGISLYYATIGHGSPAGPTPSCNRSERLC